MTLEEFLKEALAPDAYQRKGQLFANRLQVCRPALSTHLFDMRLDPFHDDGKLWAAVKFVVDNWDDPRYKDYPRLGDPIPDDE